MGLERPSSLPSSEKSRAKFIVFYIFLCVVLCAFTTFITPSSLSSPYIRNSKSGKLEQFYAQEDKSTLLMIKKIRDRSNAAGERRNLRGLGSSPPRCSSKCGRCTPCTPVHVPVPPGTPVTAEYYPEAWRCKCGNKLYMP
ncbi:EPIDERMAL PATTERNING FACTOR-like protein 6 [Raphanus sativus]|uniref:Epidermal patterning factor-like protein n=1 Tax=Raphanus sativus TaxID=3726 RepID=A0A6J0NBN9_RAPSA|nr:EPIDERMAL PATTERNING FACTOR-like protein 6 [Raphanus sativus]XP_018481258.1 EPIDERMAL PATTERNING FACTOR-like protein 6 [Raphanus sativus]KAJ4903271.1 EPIDERMAL PATTERNING FACTOR-like protein 6 [Raphanus sativus]